MTITKDIRYIGVNDHQIDLFEGHFDVPLGMAYNSYVILDKKIAVMDTVDFLTRLSPFHGSMFVTSMGSLGIPPVFHHLYDFGNIPVFLAFGMKRFENEAQPDGSVKKRRYIDFTVNTDERICDGFYFASAFKYFKHLMQDPHRLDTPPETVIRDVE